MDDFINWSALIIISVIVGLLWASSWFYVNKMIDNRLLTIALTVMNGGILMSVGVVSYLKYFR